MSDSDIEQLQGVVPESFLDLVRMHGEELDAELADCLYSGTYGQSLKHPLVFQVPYYNAGLANRALREKQRLLEQAIKDNDYQLIIDLHERPYRLEAFLDYCIGRNGDTNEPLALKDHPQWHELAAYVWTDSENISEFIEEWAALFEGRLHDPGLIIGSDDDKEAFKELPEHLTIYRADIDDGGWSWSLDVKIARFFAQRFGAEHRVLKRHTNKRHVFGYLTSRSESEILVCENWVHR